MNNYPKFAQAKGKKYKINTDYKIALECDKIGKKDIPDDERALAIIYLLFGEQGLHDSENWEELLKLGLKYLSCGKENKNIEINEEPNVDYEQDWGYIETSFFYDYGIKLKHKKYMHWWEFYNLLCGLSENCILNRVRYVRDFDISQIKDSKEKEKWIKQKEMFGLEKKQEKTAEEKRLDELFEEQLKGGGID